MRNTGKLISVLAAALFALSSPALAATAPVLSSTHPYQGDTLVISAGRKPQIATSTFDGKPFVFFGFGSNERAILPIAATTAAGPHRLYIRFKDGSTYRRTVNVRARKFPVVNLGVPDKIKESPDAVVQQFGSANSELASLFEVWQPQAFFKSIFGMPLAKFKNYGAQFGELRKTGSSMVRHMGTDFTAPAGTPVLAINAGTVAMATSTEIYGNTIMIDHGAGIYSMYLHLSRMDVSPGAAVQKGQVIGAVGDTGYAFAPHLHLSLKIKGVSVDPVQFIKTFK